VVPAFAKKLQHELTAALDAADDDVKRYAVATSELERLSSRMHAAGINVRHLGAVRACVSEWRVRDLLLADALARVAKNDLRAIMRREGRRSGVPSLDRFDRFALEFVNLCLKSPTSDRGVLFWRALTAQAASKFARIFDAPPSAPAVAAVPVAGEGVHVGGDAAVPTAASDVAIAACTTPADEVGRVTHRVLLRHLLRLLAVDLDARALSELDAGARRVCACARVR
jgi:hypothetical protein